MAAWYDEDDGANAENAPVFQSKLLEAMAMDPEELAFVTGETEDDASDEEVIVTPRGAPSTNAGTADGVGALRAGVDRPAPPAILSRQGG